MPPVRSAPPPASQPYHRLRALACLGCAAGFFLCIGNAVRRERTEAVTVAGGAVVAESPPQVPVPAGPAIVIDPGHGGKDPGRVSGSEYEKKWALSVSLALADELRRLGHSVELTRTDDRFVELVDRAAFSNRETRAAFVSIHFNAAASDASGIETYYAWPREPETMARMALRHQVPPDMQILDERSRLLAERVQASVTAATGARDRGALNNNSHAVTRRTEAPAILVECGFLTNPAELALIESDEYRALMVRGLAEGIHGWLRDGSGGPQAVRFEPATTAEPTIPATVMPENP